MERVREHELALTGYMLERLATVPGLRVVGPPEAERRGALVSFMLDGMHPHDIAELARPRGRLRPRRPSLRPAADALARAWGRRRGPASASTTTRSDVDALVAALHSGREVFGL